MRRYSCVFFFRSKKMHANGTMNRLTEFLKRKCVFVYKKCTINECVRVCTCVLKHLVVNVAIEYVATATITATTTATATATTERRRKQRQYIEEAKIDYLEIVAIVRQWWRWWWSGAASEFNETHNIMLDVDSHTHTRSRSHTKTDSLRVNIWFLFVFYRSVLRSANLLLRFVVFSSSTSSKSK